LLKIQKVNVFYKEIQVIYDLDIDVRDGEFVALLGSNGSGKTTILNAICGIIPRTSGDIYFRDQLCPVNNTPLIYEWGIVQVPEGGKILPHMTVKENLLMGASGRDEAWAKRNDTLDRIYEIFPKLKNRYSQEARLLSGGERQLLVVARGLMALPKLLMIDEPSLGLAPLVLLEVYEAFKRLHDEGLTILLSEQNVNQALKIASRGYVLENGRIVLEGSSEDLLGNTLIQKAFLGI
jgi:branched-chain amino acid transport system ATP-binding protein